MSSSSHLYSRETHDAEFGNQNDHLIIIFWFGIRFHANFFFVFQFINKEKSGLKSSKFKDSGNSCDGVRNKVISSFSESVQDGFGIIDCIFTSGIEVKTCHENTNSSSKSGSFGL